MSSIPNEQEKFARYRAFWDRAETDRPLLGATLPTFPSLRAIRAEGTLAPASLDLDELLAEVEEEWQAWREATGDSVWCALPLWAFPWRLAIAGSTIQREGNNVWGLPTLADWSQLEQIRFSPDNVWLQLLLKFQRALVQQAAGRYPVGIGPMGLGPADMMMQLRGQERLALDFYDAPQMVSRLGERCAALCVEVTKALFAELPRCEGGYAGTLRYFWAPGQLIEDPEDIGYMTAPPVHQRFVMPIHRAVGDAFPYLIVHTHSQQLHTVDNLLASAEVGAIQITPDFGEDLRQYLPVLARILERKRLILHGVMSPESIRDLRQALPARGLAIFVRCNDPEEARATLGEII
ncbi:MAG: uroporphyrinogen decarboxylase/cobalamine-independent methonine synthase family protein [Chloroflexota bacterium]